MSRLGSLPMHPKRHAISFHGQESHPTTRISCRSVKACWVGSKPPDHPSSAAWRRIRAPCRVAEVETFFSFFFHSSFLCALLPLTVLLSVHFAPVCFFFLADCVTMTWCRGQEEGFDQERDIVKQHVM